MSKHLLTSLFLVLVLGWPDDSAPETTPDAATDTTSDTGTDDTGTDTDTTGADTDDTGSVTDDTGTDSGTDTDDTGTDTDDTGTDTGGTGTEDTGTDDTGTDDTGTDTGECVPDCADKACGGDGCGNSCGACGAGMICTADAQCVADTGPTCGDMSGLQAGSPWPMRQRCPTHQSRAAYAGPKTGAVLWTFSTGDDVRSSRDRC